MADDFEKKIMDGNGNNPNGRENTIFSENLNDRATRFDTNVRGTTGLTIPGQRGATNV